jgi:hypothetical protein
MRIFGDSPVTEHITATVVEPGIGREPAQSSKPAHSVRMGCSKNSSKTSVNEIGRVFLNMAIHASRLVLVPADFCHAERVEMRS